MRRAPLFWSVLVLAVAVAFAHAWSLGWTCDDAYISFRYAKNFVDGNGLVFNLDPTEAPVEGYTNFTWTMWLAVGIALNHRQAASQCGRDPGLADFQAPSVDLLLASQKLQKRAFAAADIEYPCAWAHQLENLEKVLALVVHVRPRS